MCNIELYACLISMFCGAGRCSVVLLGLPVDADTLHAILRLVLRLTRDHKFAEMFASMGGPRLLLELNQSQRFQGFFSLVSLILRHILEDDRALHHGMEKVVVQHHNKYELNDLYLQKSRFKKQNLNNNYNVKKR